MGDPFTQESDQGYRVFALMGRLYARLIFRHWVISALVVIVFAAVLCQSFWFGRPTQRLAYFGAIIFSVLVVDLMTLRRPAVPLPVRRPVFELAMVTGCLAISFCWLLFHFNAPSSAGPSNMFAKLIRIAGALVVFNIPIALVDLFGLRYHLSELGFKFVRGLWAVPLILLTFFGLAYLSGANSTIGAVIREEGSFLRAVLVVILVAALPEEFFRMTWQTRLAAVTGNKATAWFLTAFLWSFMHAPNFHNGEPAWAPALVNCLNLVPLGLLWGYVLHRTGSLVPSMILHIFNLSGLQNF